MKKGLKKWIGTTKNSMDLSKSNMQSNKGSAHKIIQNIDKALKETKNFKKLKKGLNKISKKKPFLNPRFMS